MAGSLKRLGLHIPQPELEAGPSNPRGFYESRWVLRFHMGNLKKLRVRNIDTRPAAVDIVGELVAAGELTAQLTDWLSTQLEHERLLVKDPHAFWFAEVWAEATSKLDVDLRWLTALRHPAEVVGSRDLAYLQEASDELRREKETSNVAGWVHAALLTEKAGRGGRRSFIRYTDLLADWRQALTPVAEQLDLQLNADLGARDHHPVDDFLETSLRRSTLGWDDIRVPAWLREMAEEVWQILGGMVEDPHNEGGMARLDEIHRDYREMYADAAALTFDDRWALNQERQEVIQRLRKRARRQKENLAQLREQVAAAEQSPVRRWGRALVARRPRR